VPKPLGEYFEEMFKNIDANLESLNIAEYSIRSASLEEVFIDIGEREKMGELPLTSSTSRFSRTSSHSSMREQRTELGEKTLGRSFMTFFYLNFKSSIAKIIVGIIAAVILISIAASVVTLVSRVPSPAINMGNPQSIYGQLTVPYNDLTIIGGQSTATFFTSQPDITPQPIAVQGPIATPLDALTSWASTLYT